MGLSNGNYLFFLKLDEWKLFCSDKIEHWKNLFSRQLCAETILPSSSKSFSFDMNKFIKTFGKIAEAAVIKLKN